MSGAASHPDRPAGARVSVVVPAHADGVALASGLPRLARLPGVDEIVLADGGGNEEALPLAASVGARVVSCGGGRGPQLNAGAAAATGDHLLFLHADCWLDDGAIDEAFARLAATGVAAVVFRQQIEGERKAYRWIERAASRRAVVRRRPYGDSGLFLRRRDFERIGGYPALPLCEDLAMGARLASVGAIVEAESRIHLSARRWERHGVVWTTLLNWTIARAFQMGVPPAKLYRLYYGRPPQGKASGRGMPSERGAAPEGTGE